MSTSLELKAIERRYGSFCAVGDLSLSIAPGEFLTFLGPSGSGKTTVLKMIAGFDRPSAGDIFLGGRSIVSLAPYERGIGMVFQNYALFPHMTVEDNVAFPLTVRKTARAEIEQRVRQTLTLTKMDPYAGRYPNQLSGGQQQRVALARAIIFNPHILLMDEPLGALDRNLREHMKIEIMRIQKELNITVVFVTHDQDEALTMSDRIAVMNEGRLVQVADSRSLYSMPAGRFVAEFVGESNLVPCRTRSVGADDVVEVIINERRCGAARTGVIEQGKDTFLFVRPEHVAVRVRGSVDGQTRSDGLDGIVSQALFLGESTRYEISCGEFVFTVKRQNQGQPTLEVGHPVIVSWSRDHALVMT